MVSWGFCCLFVSFRSVHGCMGVNVWVEICLYDAILVRRLWTVEKAVLGHDLQCRRYRHHQAPRVRFTGIQPGELLKAVRKGLLWRFLDKALLSGNAGVCVEHIWKCVLSVPRYEGLGRGAVVRSISQASWPSPTDTLDRKRTTQRRRHI